MDENLIPKLVRVEAIRQETPEIRSIRLGLQDANLRDGFTFKPGQFCLLSVFGEGEAAFCIASPPMWRDFFEVCVKRVGKLTTAVHDLEVGEKMGLRGPYGNSFPFEGNFGRRMVFIGGGIGLAPLRPLIWQTLAHRDNFKDIYIIYGARTVQDLVFKADLEAWGKMEDITLVTSVDPGGEDDTWEGRVGLVPEVLETVGPPPDSVLIACGPPLMLKFVFLSAGKMGFKPSDVVTTLETKMKCGVGTCGRCNIGHRYVCRDGPIFTLEEIQSLPNEF